jgi:hypothetical protein
MPRRALSWSSLAVLLLLAACAGGDASSQPPSGQPPPRPAADDPFAPQADTSEGLTNVGTDLDAVLEHGALAGACDAYAAAPHDRHARLLCGKAMFFYEGFGTAGVPTPIMTWLLDHFPDEVGPGFASLGLVADPSSAAHLPLGFGPGAELGSVDTRAFTCASCHFARLPDGRYSVGAPNHAYRYGEHNLMMAVLPALSIPGADPAAHDPAALALLQPLRDRMAADPSIGLELLGALLPLVTSGGAMPAFSAANEHFYATWLSGTMDFFIQPLAYDDGVHTISKISALWDLPDEAERAARGQPSAFLGWTGGTATLLNFARGFVDLGGGVLADWPDERLGPLVDYVYSLRAPANPAPADGAEVARGAQLFADATVGCLGCHDGPRGAGRRLFDYGDIGTDDAMRRWVDADLDGAADNGIRFEPGDTITHQLKSPRLVGLWTMTRFLHNGSVPSLGSLLCLDGPRGDVTEPAYGNGGHLFGCDLPESDRRALVAFLLAH